MRRFAVLIALAALAIQPSAVRAEELRLEPVRSISGELLIPVAETGAGDSARGALTNGRALAIGIGAIAGVVALNYAMGGFAYVPGLAGYAAAEPAAAGAAGAVAAAPAAISSPAILASTVAISRVYAITSAAVGGFIGNWIYGQ